MTEEILDAIKDKTDESCISNLTKTHCENLKKFKREQLPEGTWITTKRFVNKTNRPVPDTMFELFREFKSQSGSDDHDTMIGWSYDNFHMLEGIFKVALSQRNTTLQTWLSNMADEHTPGDELALYILACMYRRHVYVFTQMFWWTTLLYTLPVTEKELMTRCDIKLVYIWDGVFGELDAIRGPSTMHKMSTTPPQKPLTPLELPTLSTQDSIADPKATELDLGKPPQNTGITQSTAEIGTSTSDTSVTSESASAPHAAEYEQSQPLAMGNANAVKTSVVIPESTEGE